MNIKIIAAMSLVAVSACAFGANPPGFTDDYDAAIKRASEEKKTVLAIFSGSDWCYWCKLLESGILVKQEFTDAVTNDLVCLFVDSPNDKSRISEKARVQNPKLVKKYGIQRYPSILLLDAKGNKIAEPKGMSLSPGEWGKSLVLASKSAAVNGPLIEKHVKPFSDRIEAIKAKCMADVQAAQGKGLDQSALQAEMMRIFADLRKQFGDLKKEVEAYSFPKELEAEKADLLSEIGKVEKSGAGK